MGKIKKILLIIICANFSVGFSLAIEKTYLIPNLNNPATIVMNNNRIYVEDGTTIKLFGRNDFKYIKTIGREGQGPGEFQGSANPQILPEKLLVSSSNKISYFTLSGDFIKDKKHTLFGSKIRAVNNKYVGFVWVFREDYVAYILYNSDVKPIKELHRGKALLHTNGRRDLFEIFFYDTYKDKIVVAHREGFIIDIFDSNGNRIYSIKHKVKPVPFTNEDREKVIRYWREERGLDQWQIEYLEKRTDFPGNYPPIQTCRLADGKIYVVTYTKKDDQYECLIYDVNGKFLKKAYLPLKMLAPNHAFPFSINGNNLYQLIYNNEDNIWELHVNRID